MIGLLLQNIVNYGLENGHIVEFVPRPRPIQITGYALAEKIAAARLW